MKAYLLVAGLAGLVPAAPGEVFVLYPKVEGGAQHRTALGFFESDLLEGKTCKSLGAMRREVNGEDVCWVHLVRKEIKLGGRAGDAAEIERSDYFLDLGELFESERLAKAAKDCLPPRIDSLLPKVSQCEGLQARLHVKYVAAAACDVSGMSYGAFFPVRYHYLRSQEHAQDLAAGLELTLEYESSYVPIVITSLDDAGAPVVSFKLAPKGGRDKVQLIVNNYPTASHLLDGRMLDMHSRATLDLSEQCVERSCPPWGGRPFGAGGPPLVTGLRYDCASSFARSSSSLFKRVQSRFPFPLNLLDYSQRAVILNDNHATPIGVMDGLLGPPICPKAVFTP